MKIQHQPEQSRWTAAVEGGDAELAYMEREGGALDLQHTYVPAPSRGQGIGEALVSEAFRHARAQGLRIVPSCPFVRAWLERHPEERAIAD